MNLMHLPKNIKQKNAKPFFAKQIIAISALSLFTTLSFAQKGFDFGLKGELQSSSLVNLPDQAAGNELNFKDRMGGEVGIAAGYSFTKHIGAEIDILSSSQGTQYTGDATLIQNNAKLMCNELKGLAQLNNIPFTSYYNASAYLSYIKIPILFRYNMKNTKRVYFSMFIGPQFDFLSSATIKINGTTVSKFGGNLTAKDLYKKSETDGVFALGLCINVSKNIFITAHLRFDGSLGDVENKSATYTDGTGSHNFYATGRGTTYNVTGGGMIGVSYRLLKKDKDEKKKSKSGDEETKTKTKTKTTTTTTTPPAPAAKPKQ